MMASPKHRKYFKKPIVLKFDSTDWACVEKVFEDALARNSDNTENVDPNTNTSTNNYDNYLLGNDIVLEYRVSHIET